MMMMMMMIMMMMMMMEKKRQKQFIETEKEHNYYEALKPSPYHGI